MSVNIQSLRLPFLSILLLTTLPVFSEEVWKPLRGPYGGTFNYFVFSSESENTIFTGLAMGDAGSPLYRTTDGGTSWKQMPVSGVLRIDPQDTNRALVFGSGVWLSSDLGETWSRINENDTFFQSDVEFSSLEPEVIYAAHSDWLPPNNELWGQFVTKSTDHGKTWTKLPTIGRLIVSENFMQLEVAPGSDFLFAQLPSGKVLKSTNGGLNWKSASRGIVTKPQGLGSSAWTLVLDKTRPSILFTSGPTGLYRTTDGGSLWQKIDLKCADCVPKSVSIDPFDARTIYVCGAGTHKALKSTDDGNTWNPMPLPPYPGLPYLSIAVHPSSAKIAFAALTSRGILKSTNGGASWKPANKGLSELDIVDLAADPQRRGSLIAIGAPRDGSSPFIPLFSQNNGGSWLYNPVLGGIEPREIAIQRSDPNFRVLAGLHLAATTDGGKRWNVGRIQWCQKVQIGGKEKSIFCLGADPGPISRSTDLGNSWTHFGPPISHQFEVGFLSVDQKDSNIIYTVSGANDENSPPSLIHKTTDGGKTWRLLNRPEGQQGAGYVTEFHLHPANPSLIYASTWGGIFKSTDGGGTWKNIAPGFKVHFITLDPSNPNQLFVVREEMWRTQDGGNTWSKLTQHGLPNGPPTTILMISPWDPKILYGATFRGLYYLRMPS